MGGPAMIEGGGLGVFRPEEIGPASVQRRSGVIDIAVADEAEGVAVAKRYLAYFQGRVADWTAPDQQRMRAIVPENRLRVYDIRKVIETLADEGSTLELRRDFGRTMVTTLIRIEGAPSVSSPTTRPSSAVPSTATARTRPRALQLCDAFDIPIVNLRYAGHHGRPRDREDRAGAPRRAHVPHRQQRLGAVLHRHLRKAYGLGAVAMAGGNFRAPYFTVAWPTGEFAPWAAKAR